MRLAVASVESAALFVLLRIKLPHGTLCVQDSLSLGQCRMTADISLLLHPLAETFNERFVVYKTLVTSRKLHDSIHTAKIELPVQ